MENIAQILNSRRKTLGMSQESLALLAGVSPPTLQRFFGTRSANISLDTAVKLVQALGMTIKLSEHKAERLVEAQARKKARDMTATMLSTPALKKGRQLNARAVEEVLFFDLMTGPKNRIWME